MSTRTVAERAPRILIVDDDPAILDFLAFILDDQGYRVSTAHDGEEALRVMAGEKPDVIVTDLMMPHMDGWELIQRIRRQPAPVRAIIAMSAVKGNLERTDSADLCLTKPFEVEQLITSVRSLLGASARP
jgi:DNA-binding response OmpR family regulator